jgi:hypothetical protein
MKEISKQRKAALLQGYLKPKNNEEKKSLKKDKRKNRK